MTEWNAEQNHRAAEILTHAMQACFLGYDNEAESHAYYLMWNRRETLTHSFDVPYCNRLDEDFKNYTSRVL